MPKKMESLNELIKEFDKKFGLISLEARNNPTRLCSPSTEEWWAIKEFIRYAIKEALEDVMDIRINVTKNPYAASFDGVQTMQEIERLHKEKAKEWGIEIK